MPAPDTRSLADKLACQRLLRLYLLLGSVDFFLVNAEGNTIGPSRFFNIIVKHGDVYRNYFKMMVNTMSKEGKSLTFHADNFEIIFETKFLF